LIRKNTPLAKLLLEGTSKPAAQLNLNDSSEPEAVTLN
jgi:hypothetical protein